MTHTYTVTGMHCESCVQKVQKALSSIPNVTKAAVTLEPPNAIVTMDAHVPVESFNQALGSMGYALEENAHGMQTHAMRDRKSVV